MTVFKHIITVNLVQHYMSNFNEIFTLHYDKADKLLTKA